MRSKRRLVLGTVEDDDFIGFPVKVGPDVGRPLDLSLLPIAAGGSCAPPFHGTSVCFNALMVRRRAALFRAGSSKPTFGRNFGVYCPVALTMVYSR
jgi:hypothetical protein